MKHTLLGLLTILVIASWSMSSCSLVKGNAKYEFNDGIYHIKRFSGNEVYVLHVDEDTIAVFPVLEFPDSTAILIKQRINYTSLQKKFKDNKIVHTFYKPSVDVDAMTIPLKYRPAVDGFPNQMTTNFNGALYCGYRIDEYRLSYKRTPLNVYKQSEKHKGYSVGLYAGVGSTLIDGTALNNPNSPIQYDGALLIAGVAANIAVEKLTFGISFGSDHLLDKYHAEWLYEGKPCVGFTLGLNIN